MGTVLNEDERPREEPDEAPLGQAGLLRRQLLFLRRTWWRSDPLTAPQRAAILLRGVFLTAIGGVGLIAAVANTVAPEAAGMQAVAKLMAEFLLIPIAILGLIITGFGISLIIRGFMPNPAGHGEAES